MSPDDAKRAAAARACDLVRDGMVVGLGTGSTVRFLVDELGRRGTRIVGVPTSERTRIQAEGLQIRLADLEDEPELDLTIDGADEIDPDLNLIKGGGGALLREKLVAAASRRFVVIADAGKRVARLGRFPLPVEIVAFGHATTRRRVETLLGDLALPAEARLRLGADGLPVRTDNTNLVLDLSLEEIPDPAGLATALKGVLGVVEHGLFVGMAASALIGGPDGVMEVGPP